MPNTKARPPFRYDIVGSFLRPKELKAKREAFAKGEISAEDLRAAEDTHIRQLVQNQKDCGLHAVTDGELRRRFWHLDFLAALDGLQEVQVEKFPVAFKGVQPKASTLQLVDKVGFPKNHPFLRDFAFLQSLAGDRLAKFTIPSPSMVHLICCIRDTAYKPLAIYKDTDALLQDIAQTYRDAVHAFYDAGCRYLQFDDTSWGEFCDVSKRKVHEAQGVDLDAVARDYVQMINRALQDKPADMTVTMHICRGNFRSTWFSSGGYEPVAETLFGHCKVDGFFLEYDSDRAGGFEPLRFMDKQEVVLGLVTSKSPQLEKKEDVIARIHEAEKYVPLHRLAISPQCGFSSTEEGNLLTEAEQWAKIRLLREIAQSVWQDA